MENQENLNVYKATYKIYTSSPSDFSGSIFFSNNVKRMHEFKAKNDDEALKYAIKHLDELKKEEEFEGLTLHDEYTARLGLEELARLIDVPKEKQPRIPTPTGHYDSSFP